MITNERIDELLKQKAKIWGIGKQGNVFCVGLKFRPETLKNKKWLENKYKVYSKFFETEEEAKWFAEFGCIERTERLELPTWDKVEKMVKDKHFISDTQYFMGFDLTYRICVEKKNVYIYSQEFESVYWEMIFGKQLTKENYTLACRKAKELFLKGSVND